MSLIGRPRKGFNVVSYNWQKTVREAKKSLSDDERRVLMDLRTYGGGVDFQGTVDLMLIKSMIKKNLCRGDVRNTWATDLGKAVIQ